MNNFQLKIKLIHSNHSNTLLSIVIKSYMESITFNSKLNLLPIIINSNEFVLNYYLSDKFANKYGSIREEFLYEYLNIALMIIMSTTNKILSLYNCECK